MDEELLDLSINSRDGMVFEGKAKSITSYNEDGKFDILPYHANFISLLNTKITYVDIADNEHDLDIESALLRLRNKKAEIYLGVKAFSESFE